MERARHLLTTLLLLCTMTATAHDFEVGGICYNILTDSTVEVTYQGSSYKDDYHKYSGSVTIPETVTTSRGITYSVTNIESCAFMKCSSLKSATIGNSVTTIGGSAFEGCSGLNAVHISNIAAWCNISFTGYLANPLYYAKTLYLNGNLLTALTVPDEITQIKNYAFYNCKGLKNVTICDGVKSIGAYAFNGCNNMETLYISSTIESFGNYAFADCNNIFEIKTASKKAVTASENVFSSDAYINACLYVPAGRKFAYEKATPWNNFHIVEMDFTGIDEVLEDVKTEPAVDASQNVKVQTIYDLNGRAVENPSNGIYIVNGKKMLVK